ncbi:MAG: RibD family protein [Bacteroidota bacterium]
MKRIWTAILNLKAAVTAFELPITACWLNKETGEVAINQKPTDYPSFVLILCNQDRPVYLSETTTFVLAESGNLITLNERGIGVAEVLFLKKYLPYCLLAIKAKQYKRAISVTHFAQTLDAKIATNTGDSKWIGNDENLIHAHRMRALCDGVLVGRKTVETDHPKLNVRHVCGNDPIRIVLGNPQSDFQSLLACSDAKILVFSKDEQLYEKAVTSIHMPLRRSQSTIEPVVILQKLYELGIYSIYIEGGAKTTSIFIQSKAVDVIQLHIAPIIFGSGKSGIELANIDLVKEAINFKEYHFLPFGDSVMFTGFLIGESRAESRD